MTALHAEVVRAAEPPELAGAEIGYVTADGIEHEIPLGQAWATPFESCRPVRRFLSHKGQRHLSGLWWSATVGGHVGFESWLERDHVMALDFDPSVVGISSQPFWLSWRDEAGKAISHAPDFFARRADGTAVVIDCRPVERRKPRDVAKFEATERACAVLGWSYRLVGAPDPVVTANLRWLAGYRHPRHDLLGVSEMLRRVFAKPAPLMAGAAVVGDPIAVLPVLFHLLWCGVLAVDVSVPLHQETVARYAAAGR